LVSIGGVNENWKGGCIYNIRSVIRKCTMKIVITPGSFEMCNVSRGTASIITIEKDII
jgi:hypothetical protein